MKNHTIKNKYLIIILPIVMFNCFNPMGVVEGTTNTTSDETNSSGKISDTTNSNTINSSGISLTEPSPTGSESTKSSSTESNSTEVTTSLVTSEITSSSSSTGLLEDTNSFESESSSTTESFEPSIVFVTSMTFDGNFVGTMSLNKSPDERCQEIAQVVGLPGNFRAWVSYINDTALSRMSSIQGQIIRIDNIVVADSLSELTSGNLKNPINIDEKGNIFNTEVWTGTLPNGNLSLAGNCGEWQSNANPFKGDYGFSGSIEQEWTYIGNQIVCDELKALYCFEVKI